VRSFVVSEIDGVFSRGVNDIELTRHDETDVLVRIEHSGINFKDALVAQPQSRVRRTPTLVAGVDAAGVVEECPSATMARGTRVVVHGGNLGVGRDGGFASFVYAPERYVNVLPDSLSTRSAMIIGTAGFTAMASVLALEHHGLDKGGDVLVTGATGGVGSLALSILAARGYRPVASTGSVEEAQWLHERGASRIIGRDDIADRHERVLGSERWVGAIDCVGGDTLHQILRSLQYGGAVAASGLVGGSDLATNVYPFITRAVALLGIDAVETTSDDRRKVWSELALLASSLDLEALVDRTVALDDVESALNVIAKGATRGRILVNPI
jgi:acrylyl-CoA reductase (NADPH)